MVENRDEAFNHFLTLSCVYLLKGCGNYIVISVMGKSRDCKDLILVYLLSGTQEITR